MVLLAPQLRGCLSRLSKLTGIAPACLVTSTAKPAYKGDSHSGSLAIAAAWVAPSASEAGTIGPLLG